MLYEYYRILGEWQIFLRQVVDNIERNNCFNIVDHGYVFGLSDDNNLNENDLIIVLNKLLIILALLLDDGCDVNENETAKKTFVLFQILLEI